MLNGLYTSGLGAIAQSVRLDVIANNLANVDTPAFRRDQIAFRERLVEALEGGQDTKYYNALVDRHGGAPFIESITFDPQAGGYEETSRPLDFSIVGEGFFAVRPVDDPDRIFYTRAGNFQFGSNGRLMTADGKYEVLNEDMSEIQLIEDQPLQFTLDKDDGFLVQGDVPIGRLATIEFQDATRLAKHGDTLFVSRDAIAKDQSTSNIQQGFLEKSSSDPLFEMTEMIKTLRMLETNLQMVRMQDGTLDRLINNFAKMER